MNSIQTIYLEKQFFDENKSFIPNMISDIEKQKKNQNQTGNNSSETNVWRIARKFGQLK